MSISNSDDSYLFDLNKQIHFQEMHLNHIAIPNLFCNFAADENVMSVNIAGTVHTVLIDDFITISSWASYFNAKVANQNVKIIEVSNPAVWEVVLQFKVQLNGVDVISSIQGSAWYKLGCTTGVIRGIHKGTRAVDFQGPQCIHMQVQGLQSVNQQLISSTFQIPVNNGFGGLIVYSQWQEDNHNLYQSQTPNSVTQLNIQLLDQRGRSLRTIKGNNSGVNQQKLSWSALITYHDNISD